MFPLVKFANFKPSAALRWSDFSYQAATWLGISDPAKLLDDDPAATAFQPRPEGLGLGAKFLAHHKVRNADVCFVT